MTTPIRQLLALEPLLLPLLGSLAFVPDASIARLSASGGSIHWNPAFVATLSQRRALFHLAHEVGHIALRHHRLIGLGLDRELVNYAGDVEVNLALLHCNAWHEEAGCEPPFDIPPDAIVERRYLGVAAHHLCLHIGQGRALPEHRRPITLQVCRTGRRNNHAALRPSLFNPRGMLLVQGDNFQAVSAGTPSVRI